MPLLSFLQNTSDSTENTGGSFVFTLDEESQPILQYFAGLGPLPAD